MNDSGLLVDLKGVHKSYSTPAGDVQALRQIDLQIRAGEFVAVTGKSGAGKSTLVNMVTGIDRPTAGEVWMGSRPVHDMTEDQIAHWRGQTVGVVFQFFHLLPMLTCAQNVMLPMDFAGLYRAASGSAWRSPAPWQTTLSFWPLTSPPAISIRLRRVPS